MERKWFKLAAVVFLASILIPAAGAKEVRLSNAVAWCQAADTYKECVLQAYLNGMERLKKLAAGEQAGTWCVVLDADETVLSNVRFQADLEAMGEQYSGPLWTTWCLKEEATALPGAAEFCALARRLGGKVVICTNRKGDVKDATAANLKKVGIPYDVLLVREGAYALDRDKTMRRGDIEQGTIKTLPSGTKLPPLKILMLCGDQNHDLYDAKKVSFDEAAPRFGTDLVVLPNPMYGDWANEGVFVETAAPGTGGVAAAAGGGMTWQEAIKQGVGAEVTVETRIINVYDPEERGKGGPVKLNVDRNWRESLTFIFYKKNRDGSDNGFLPPRQYLNKTVRVKGRIDEYQGAMQIKLDSPSQIQVVD
ncbi:MAG TPA: HAD family acid phosphatase [bacterium]|nr:HAD family acid phosphatase [bacterium]HPJ71823.1 HAD family acid phosphatase [bacterium]HPQ66864.1 HAD family acid phosphatase [bacterium]